MNILVHMVLFPHGTVFVVRKGYSHRDRRRSRMKRLLYIAVLTIYSGVFLWAGGSREEKSDVSPVIIFAAASTVDVMQDLADLFKGKTGYTVLISPASSGILAKQLEEGAQADIFISASKKWMDYTVNLEMVDESRAMAGNRMVLIAPSDSTDQSVEIAGSLDFPASFAGRLSIGDPEHVPAGAYARESLVYFHWYDSLLPRLLPAANVRAALAVVELGECERGIVYRTDALKSDKVKVIGTFPSESHSDVSYYCGLLKQAGHGGREFYAFLAGDEAAAVFEKYGFEGL